MVMVPGTWLLVSDSDPMAPRLPPHEELDTALFFIDDAPAGSETREQGLQVRTRSCGVQSSA